MQDITIVYFTSNREDPEFEEKIQKTLCEATGGLPIVSVSQKPIGFGRNICVGDIGASRNGLLRQLKIGAQEAETKFIATAEADCLFHESYYDFQPSREDVIYRPDLIYVVWVNHPYYFYGKTRTYVEGITGREHLVSVIDTMEKQIAGGQFKHINNISEGVTFHPEIPVVTFKTGNGMHLKAPYTRKRRVARLPYWGRPKNLTAQYIN